MATALKRAGFTPRELELPALRSPKSEHEQNVHCAAPFAVGSVGRRRASFSTIFLLKVDKMRQKPVKNALTNIAFWIFRKNCISVPKKNADYEWDPG
jgi:hypothetical protein